MIHPITKNVPKISFEGAATASRQRMALYARVSTEEQTKGSYPSCQSQIEELEDECRRRGLEAYRVIRDEGFTAATMHRPGLTELRMLVQADEIDGILCTWYDRLTRSRDFYVLDNEFRTHNVSFLTLHDPADTRTAAGRFMESMIVAAKTYERDQTSEKVRTKMRMRLEKGLHQGGLVPFGFLCDAETKLLTPDPKKLGVLRQVFEHYIDTRSDFAVRDWLHAHQVLSPRDVALWPVSTIRDLLSNRRYIAEIEVNRKNKGVEGLPEVETYRTIPAAYQPMVPLETFAMAQAIRKEKGRTSSNRRGRPRSYSQTQCKRVYSLQGILTCGYCDHAMTPWYVHHKPGKGRKKESFVNYYACAQQIKAWKHCDHKNMILAHRAESWVLDQVGQLIESPTIIERALHHAQSGCESALEPQKEALSLTRAALLENQAQIDQMLEAVGSGKAAGALFDMLNEKAALLQRERERLRMEQRKLMQALLPIENSFDAATFGRRLADFSTLAKAAEPEELQRLLRLTVRKMEWMPDGAHRMELYLPMGAPGKTPSTDWFKTNERSDGPDRIRTGDLLRDRQACWATTPRDQVIKLRFE